ncbi:Uncharacterized protein MK1270 [Methanopyrus kandleri AV19]|uniref:Uncharacterized protein n=1 Tax=Methanopyrus kandleri (strain AV19 / DSM 6324 / JCM 9639 / NBRC 100938) TaxID=190192 RepID=Q8TVW8_METKA|nr:Uncharacterized protein MK1270 [Methanopyrus kandleri AV19]
MDTGAVDDGMIVVVRSDYRTLDSDEPTWSMSYRVVRYDLVTSPRVLPVSGGPSESRSDPRMYPIGAFYDPDRDRLLVITYHPRLVLPGGDETPGVLVSEISGASRDPRFVGCRTLTITTPNDADDVKPVLPEVIDGKPYLVYVEPGEPFEEGGTREYRLVRLDLETGAREVLAEFGERTRVAGEPRTLHRLLGGSVLPRLRARLGRGRAGVRRSSRPSQAARGLDGQVLRVPATVRRRPDGRRVRRPRLDRSEPDRTRSTETRRLDRDRVAVPTTLGRPALPVDRSQVHGDGVDRGLLLGRATVRAGPGVQGDPRRR